MEPRIIKTEDQYEQYLSEVERLALNDPDPNSKDGIRLELLAKLVEDYEKERIVFRKPDPVEAIEFRMEQKGLRQKDIAEILGGKNRASEILSRKRPLTLPMIRALYEKLGIPPELLIREADVIYEPNVEISEADVPIDLLLKRGWVSSTKAVSEMLNRFVLPGDSPVMMKRTLTFGASARTNHAHVWLWLSRVREIADSRGYLAGRFKKEVITEEMLRYVAKLSWMDKGPRLAKEFLEERGIALVIEPHLPSTHLDGAAMIGKSGAPVIGMSLREDRLDNFWFTLMHELVHVWKHLDGNTRRAIADENIEKASDNATIEKEANEVASEILIPKSVWRRSGAHLNPSTASIVELAGQLQVSPAIIAGRVRYERRKYSLFSGLVGYRQARVQFSEIRWD